MSAAQVTRRCGLAIARLPLDSRARISARTADLPPGRDGGLRYACLYSCHHSRPDGNGRGTRGIGNPGIIDRHIARFRLEDRKTQGLLEGFYDILPGRQGIDPVLPKIVGPRLSCMGELALAVAESGAEGRYLGSLYGFTIFVKENRMLAIGLSLGGRVGIMTQDRGTCYLAAGWIRNELLPALS